MRLFGWWVPETPRRGGEGEGRGGEGKGRGWGEGGEEGEEGEQAAIAVILPLNRSLTYISSSLSLTHRAVNQMVYTFVIESSASLR